MLTSSDDIGGRQGLRDAFAEVDMLLHATHHLLGRQREGHDEEVGVHPFTQHLNLRSEPDGTPRRVLKWNSIRRRLHGFIYNVEILRTIGVRQ